MPDATQTTFQGFWHGPVLGPICRACLSSFITCGHRFELYTYDPIALPPGVVRLDAGAVIERSELFYYYDPRTGRTDLGPFSDLFRFKLLSERGGWWSDVDAICLSSTIPAAVEAWARELPELNGRAVGTSQVALERGSRLSRALYEKCLALSKTAYPRRESLGPRLLSQTLEELSLPPDKLGTPELFYPVRWIEAFKLWIPAYYDEIAERAERAWFMPVYQSFPRYLGLGLDAHPPRGSFLGRLCQEAGVEGRPLEADAVVGAVREYFATEASWAIPELLAVGGDRDVVLLDL